MSATLCWKCFPANFKTCFCFSQDANARTHDLNWASSWENLSYGICEQQRRRSRSLISAFVVLCLDSVIPILAKSKISRLLLVSVAEQAGLSLTGLQNPEERFSRDHDMIQLLDQAGSSPTQGCADGSVCSPVGLPCACTWPGGWWGSTRNCL